MAERQFGPYRLVRQIAVGGMAEIHLAKTTGVAGFEKYVALKMIHPNFAEDDDFIQMLVDEAKIAVQLNHANIAQTFDLGRVGDQFYITMEYVDGADLYKLLRRASEIDVEMPLDVCAFVAKDIASALDHAHRKRDHLGKNLGIVHRDVSPQNVLISYAGEVKLVDFGIAKATSKARQTAAGVIKGKYYYMSPEQAWGDPIDLRSDIFSAGIVLYEMITGQMLYLEEDLHKLLDMARKADIAPPSTLRKGVPPQLERIVMHALKRVPGERYQSAGDFASDLERFLHAYAPVFTAAKVAGLLRQVVGDPVPAPEYDEIEVREGPLATHTLTSDDLIHDGAELRDENSVIFRVDELRGKPATTPPPTRAAPTRPAPAGPGRVTVQAQLEDVAPLKKVPAIPRVAKPAQRAPSRPRQANEDTRQVDAGALPAATTEESGLLSAPPPPGSGAPRAWSDEVATPAVRPTWADVVETQPSDGELENIGERTMVSAPSGNHGFMVEVAGEDGGDATVVTGAPGAGGDDDDLDEAQTLAGDQAADDDDGDGLDAPTVERDFRTRKPRVGKREPAPPALAANIHAPAVSELRRPRPSRKTPAGGTGAPNVLQALVGARPAEPIPAPVARRDDPAPPTMPGNLALGSHATPPQGGIPTPLPGQPTQPFGVAAVPPGSAHPTPPAPMPAQAMPFYGSAPQTPPYGAPQPPQTPPYGAPQGPPYAGGYAQSYQHPQVPYGAMPGPGYAPAPVTPGALYGFSAPGAPPQPMSITGQMRLFEVDELPPQYKVASGGRWIKVAVAAVLAVGIAATVTFLVMRSLQHEASPTHGSIRVASEPPGAAITYDGTRLTQATPYTIDAVSIGTHHNIEVQLAGYQPYTESVDVPKDGSEVQVTALLKPVTGTLRIVTNPDGADIFINDQLRGRSPTTITDIDMSSAKKLELRLKGYAPYVENLAWPPSGQIERQITLQRQ